MSRLPIRSSRRVVVRRQPIRNMMLDGGGASGERGPRGLAARRAAHQQPLLQQQFSVPLAGVHALVHDELGGPEDHRHPRGRRPAPAFRDHGCGHRIVHGPAQRLQKTFDLDRQNRRALIQERLHGGCCQTIVIKARRTRCCRIGFPLKRIRRGDLEAFNVVDVSRITRPDYDQESVFGRLRPRGTLHHSRVEADVSRSCSTVRRSSTGRP